MNEWERTERMAKRYKEMYPVGTRIELIQMGDDPQPVSYTHLAKSTEWL